ncbi:MAG: hypothetical protein K8F62_18200 [Pseudorhodoplanes sp.]|nr:hypothetical protein [Pseudorhodoplanes sp.]
MAVVKGSLGLLAAVALSGIIATSANAQDKSGYPYSIMREEGGAKPRTPEFGWEKEQPREPAKKPAGKRRIGSSSPSPVPPYQSTVTPLGTAPRIIETKPLGTPSSPGMIVPGVRSTTGGPALTPPRPAGQTFQDRAVSCVHAGGGAGVAPGKIGTYTRSCVNQ